MPPSRCPRMLTACGKSLFLVFLGKTETFSLVTQMNSGRVSITAEKRERDWCIFYVNFNCITNEVFLH